MSMSIGGRRDQILPIYDNHVGRGADQGLSVTVARSMEDIMRVMSIRSAVYVAEQRCPHDEEFDGNDFSATHLLGYVGDEPPESRCREFLFPNWSRGDR